MYLINFGGLMSQSYFSTPIYLQRYFICLSNYMQHAYVEGRDRSIPAQDIYFRQPLRPYMINLLQTVRFVERKKHVLLDCTVAKFFWDQAKVVSGIKIPPLIYTLLRGLGI